MSHTIHKDIYLGDCKRSKNGDRIDFEITNALITAEQQNGAQDCNTTDIVEVMSRIPSETVVHFVFVANCADKLFSRKHSKWDDYMAVKKPKTDRPTTMGRARVLRVQTSPTGTIDFQQLDPNEDADVKQLILLFVIEKFLV